MQTVPAVQSEDRPTQREGVSAAMKAHPPDRSFPTVRTITAWRKQLDSFEALKSFPQRAFRNDWMSILELGDRAAHDYIKAGAR